MMGIVTFSVQQEEGLATSRSLRASYLIYPSFYLTSANMNQSCTKFVTNFNASDKIYTQNIPRKIQTQLSISLGLLSTIINTTLAFATTLQCQEVNREHFICYPKGNRFHFHTSTSFM